MSVDRELAGLNVVGNALLQSLAVLGDDEVELLPKSCRHGL
jgi:hypothetical protein